MLNTISIIFYLFTNQAKLNIIQPTTAYSIVALKSTSFPCLVIQNAKYPVNHEFTIPFLIKNCNNTCAILTFMQFLIV